ncbi:DNA cross-link repair protein pso2/snm1 [Coprinopsis sp. MPI-PUGE-AT-0042]|nr:DNA cross-link repair protein pso2/snm1 [Coprinopsis sp. MPI-PUGE-AT-0042]
MKQRKKTQTQAPSSSSVTLLDFFNKAKPSPSSSTQGTSKKRSGATTPSNGKGKGKARPVASSSKATIASGDSEIIVISDSDDDDTVEIVEYQGVTPKRRKLSPDAQTSFQAIAGDLLQSSVKAEPANPSISFSFGSPVLLQDAVPKGELHELLPSGDALCSTSSGATVDQDNAPALNMDVEPPSSCTLPSEPEVHQVDVDLTLDDWGTGDDEMDCGVNPPKVEEETQVLLNVPITSNGDDDMEPDLDFEEFLEPKEELEFAEELPESPKANEESSSKNNAFSFLMTSHKEHEAWKEADKNPTSSSKSTSSSRRPAPFYKVLQGMPIAVDAFKYGAIPGITAYFLTHAHSDHYTNLSKSWSHGPIYCSQATANLIMHMLGVDPKWVVPLPMNEAVEVPGTGGVKVTLIDANHCPGSSLFFFEGKQTVNAGDTSFKSSFVGSERVFRYLHCGDFRASPQHILHPAVKGKEIDHVYLDTTYLDPKYTFPPQALVISACADLAQKLVAGEPVKKTGTISSWVSAGPKGKGKEADKPALFVVGTYSIGKERIVKAVAHALDSKIYCDKRKTALFKCQEDPELHSMLTSNPADAVVHVLPLNMITTDKLKPYLDRFAGQYSKVIGFRPTGWTYVQPSGTDQLPSVSTILTRTVQKSYTCEDLKPNVKSPPGVQIYPVPYSEHSSFYELTCFAMSFNWKKMIATVNVGSEKSRAKMAKWVAKWEAERKRRGKTEIIEHRHAEYW